MPLKRMLFEDDQYNQCKICMKDIKKAMPCTTCGNIICYNCTSKIIKPADLLNSGMQCPYCQSNGIKFNTTII